MCLAQDDVPSQDSYLKRPNWKDICAFQWELSYIKKKIQKLKENAVSFLLTYTLLLSSNPKH